MTREQKLEVHLLHFVCPEGVPLTGPQQLELIAKATPEQKRLAYERALTRSPLLLDDERMTKEEIHDEWISPLMTQIIAICKEHKIPIIANFCLGLEDDGLSCTTALLADEYQPSNEQLEALRILKPKAAVAFAETITTNPDGTKTISIRRIS